MGGVIEITEGCIKNDYLIVTDVRELFPDAAFGGSNEEQAGQAIHVSWGGEAVRTDIVGSGCFFRRRGWVGEFIRQHRLQVGDRVVVERLAPDRYHVYPLRQAGVGIQAQGSRG